MKYVIGFFSAFLVVGVGASTEAQHAVLEFVVAGFVPGTPFALPAQMMLAMLVCAGAFLVYWTFRSLLPQTKITMATMHSTQNTALDSPETA